MSARCVAYILTVNLPSHLVVSKVKHWELKFMLPPPKVVDLCRKVEVTSVNWKSQDAGTIASVALVSYKWHGIMCWNVAKGTLIWHLPMEEWYVSACDHVELFQFLRNNSTTLSMSPDGRFAATFGFSKFFEVRELKSRTVQSLHWQGLVIRPKKHAEAPLVCFAHEGFAVAGAAGGESKVHVWDAGRGDRLLSLDHGGECDIQEKGTVLNYSITDGFKVHSLVVRNIQHTMTNLLIWRSIDYFREGQGLFLDYNQR